VRKNRRSFPKQWVTVRYSTWVGSGLSCICDTRNILWANGYLALAAIGVGVIEAARNIEVSKPNVFEYMMKVYPIDILMSRQLISSYQLP
jgi:hypothetical protein